MSVAEDARRLVARTTAAQGLPPTVDDAAALERIAALLRPTGAQSERRPAERAA